MLLSNALSLADVPVYERTSTPGLIADKALGDSRMSRIYRQFSRQE
jgi:hypothetical protein